ncbi:hypothetical protein BXZ70DRAFT_665985 [Cristinia sonorae]|uniref:DUF6697 domain-containing protein n=1 Tax=Cristinia sonorae TaxID=1940300 RepID=A0A8K0XT15_9AGAR|nr:hypothetical protein BXZ70DRAFT_665985 [Cristinia sonorae]
MTNETIIKNKPSPASNVTAPSSFSIIRKTIGNQTTPACDPSVTTTVFRASGYRNSTAPPNQPSNERDIGQMVVQSPDSMQLFTSGTMRTSPPILTKRTASMPNIPPSSHAATPQSNMRPKHLSLLSSSGISGMDMMLMMRASLRVECDAYPALFCRENILWSFDNSPQNTILLLPKTFYEPYEGEEKQWSSNTAFTSPTGQTWEILFQEDPNAVYYAGTYECQLSPTTVPLTYSQLNEPVRAALCRDTLHPSWRCRLPGGEARQTMISTIDNAYRAGRIEIAGLRLNHVGFNQKLLQRLLVEIAGSESGTGIVKINSQPSSVAPSSKGDRSRRRSGGQNQDVMERAAKRPRGSIPT